MKVTDEDRAQYTELARRLFAAFISLQLGLKSIDNVMKQHLVDAEVGDTWIRIAKQVEASYVKSMGRRRLSE